jgi:hypothetical protein
MVHRMLYLSSHEGIYQRQTDPKGRDAKLRTFKTSALCTSTATRANPGRPGGAKLRISGDATHATCNTFTETAEPPRRLMVAESLDALKTTQEVLSMRMLKGFGLLLAAVLVVGMAGLAVVKPGSESAVSVNASFSIPSWISLSVIGSGDVSFSDITGPGSYNASNGTQLQVLSTTSWTISGEILWSESSMPAGASQSTIDQALERSYDKTSGSWGIHRVNVSYTFNVEEDAMANLPEGDYNMVIQYTATTD